MTRTLLPQLSHGDAPTPAALTSRVPRRRVLGIAVALVVTVATVGTPALAAKPNKPSRAPTTMLPLTITGVVVRDGQLVAQGTLGNNPFEAPLTLAPTGDTSPDGCPILDLSLGPIHLDLLGLVVDTSPICLDITADPEGGLLGNLLCGIAGLLDPDGGNLGTLLGGLTNTQLTTLLQGITDLLNGALAQITAPNADTSVAGSAPGATDILNLSLGPIDLNLLGLMVHLDDCNDGPVTIDITAVPGPGNLLGNLLGNLAHLLDSSASGNAIANALNRVADAILQLVS
jgi:hypothetical protein